MSSIEWENGPPDLSGCPASGWSGKCGYNSSSLGSVRPKNGVSLLNGLAIRQGIIRDIQICLVEGPTVPGPAFRRGGSPGTYQLIGCTNDVWLITATHRHHQAYPNESFHSLYGTLVFYWRRPHRKLFRWKRCSISICTLERRNTVMSTRMPFCVIVTIRSYIRCPIASVLLLMLCLFPKIGL